MKSKKRYDDGMGERLATARSHYSMTQTALSKRLGLTRAAVSQYEADRYRPGPEIMARLAQIFGSGPEWFATGVGMPPKPREGLVVIPEIEPDRVRRGVDDLREFRGSREWGLPSSELRANDLWPDGLVVVPAPEDLHDIQRGDHCLIDTTRTGRARGAIFFALDRDTRPRLTTTPSDKRLLTVLGQVVGYFRMMV